MNTLNKNTAGLALGGLLAIWHAFWSLLVLVGLAQPLLDLVFKLHFLNHSFVVQVFSFKKAVGLVLVTAIIGYVMGWIFAWMWNMLHKKQ